MSQHHVRAFDQEETKSSCRRQSAGGPVQNLVAFSTKRDQVGLRVVTKGATPSHVVNIEILGASTLLTAPTITLQDFSMQPGIQLRRLSNSRPFLRSRIIHVACSLQKLAAQRLLRMNHRWMLSVRKSVRLFPSPKQRPPENRRRSFRGSSPETCRCRA